jgi:hypothetical protein
MTNTPTENMTMACAFRFQCSFKPHRMGRGMTRMTTSWKMEMAAKNMMSGNAWTHLVEAGGVWYCQFVQLAETGTWMRGCGVSDGLGDGWLDVLGRPEAGRLAGWVRMWRWGRGRTYALC